MTEGFLAVRNQQVVEVWVGADEPGVPDAGWEYDIVDRCAELNVVAENFSQLGPCCPVVDQANTLGNDAKSGQLTAGADQGGDPELDLMAIRMAAHADIVK